MALGFVLIRKCNADLAEPKPTLIPLQSIRFHFIPFDYKLTLMFHFSFSQRGGYAFATSLILSLLLGAVVWPSVVWPSVVWPSTVWPSTVWADERLEGIACRSVHLNYPGPTGTAFYNQVSIQSSAPGTYFAVIGWDKGYFGMQELANGKKLIIFSVWDSGENDPNATPDQLRTELLYQDPEVRVKRFGGEGSGGQSFFDFDWQRDQTYEFFISSRVIANRTAYSGYFFDPNINQWRHLVTFSTITGGKSMQGFYSFVEDFKRDRTSTTFARTATFSNAARFAADSGQWIGQEKARFTGDANPVTNIDARPSQQGFQLTTGGETKNQHVPLGEMFSRAGQGEAVPAERLAAVIDGGLQKAVTPDQRRQASHRILQEQQVPFLADLQTLPPLQKLDRQAHDRTLQQAVALWLVAAKADRRENAQLQAIAEEFQARAVMTPRQLAFFDDPDSAKDATATADFLWEYESSEVLFWSLGLTDPLPWPTQVTSGELWLQRLQGTSPQHWQEQWKPRPLNEILDVADQHYRLHWSLANARYMDSDPPAQLQSEIVQQRHHACAWLLNLPSLTATQSAGSALAWDQVAPTVPRTTETASPFE